MSLNQKNPLPELSTVGKAKQIAAKVAGKVADKVDEALGIDKGKQPASDHSPPSSPDAMGIVTPDILSVSPSEANSDWSSSAWESVSSDLSPETKARRLGEKKRRKAQRKEHELLNREMDAVGDGIWGPTCPAGLSEEMVDRKWREELLRAVAGKMDKAKAKELGEKTFKAGSVASSPAKSGSSKDSRS